MPWHRRFFEKGQRLVRSLLAPSGVSSPGPAAAQVPPAGLRTLDRSQLPLTAGPWKFPAAEGDEPDLLLHAAKGLPQPCRGLQGSVTPPPLGATHEVGHP